MHPLIAAAHHNRTNSPLCRLPDAILLRVMRLSNKVTVECLRRCSRVFLRLFPAVCAPPSDLSMEYVERFPWPRSTIRWLPGETRGFLSLIASEVYCLDCREARDASSWQARVVAMTKRYIHCSGCRADHPACLFSAKERNKEQAERVCIGHEGFLRLCEHATLPWSRFSTVVNERINDTIFSFNLRFCNELIRCTRDEHVQLCWHTSSAGNEYWGPKHKWCCPSNPMADFWVAKARPGIRGKEVILRLGWAPHLRLPTRPDGRFRAEELQLGLRRLFEHQGQFICPPDRPGPVAGERIGDPSRCDCMSMSWLNCQRVLTTNVEFRRRLCGQGCNRLGTLSRSVASSS